MHSEWLCTQIGKMTPDDRYTKKVILSLKNLRIWAGFLSLMHKSTWILYIMILLIFVFPVVLENIFRLSFLQDGIQELLATLQVENISALILFAPFVVLISLFSRATIWILGQLRYRESRLIEGLIRRLFPRCRFSIVVHISRQLIQMSRLFKITSNSVVSSYGILKAEQEGRDIVLMDVGLRENTGKQKLGDGLAKIPIAGMVIVLYRVVIRSIFTKKIGENVQYSFRGIFAHSKTEIDSPVDVLILPNKLGTDLFSQTIKSLDVSRGELVELENEVFNQMFTVYSSDQIESRYLLSIGFMETMINLQKVVNAPLSLSFADGVLYLALYIPGGVFSFTKKQAINEGYLVSIQEKLNQIISIFEVISLNNDRG